MPNCRCQIGDTLYVSIRSVVKAFDFLLQTTKSPLTLYAVSTKIGPGMGVPFGRIFGTPFRMVRAMRIESASTLLPYRCTVALRFLWRLAPSLKAAIGSAIRRFQGTSRQFALSFQLALSSRVT